MASMAREENPTTGLPVSHARAANWLEQNFWMSGPRYDGILPSCDAQAALYEASNMPVVGSKRVARSGDGTGSVTRDPYRVDYTIAPETWEMLSPDYGPESRFPAGHLVADHAYWVSDLRTRGDEEWTALLEKLRRDTTVRIDESLKGNAGGSVEEAAVVVSPIISTIAAGIAIRSWSG